MHVLENKLGERMHSNDWFAMPDMQGHGVDRHEEIPYAWFAMRWDPSMEPQQRGNRRCLSWYVKVRPFVDGDPNGGAERMKAKHAPMPSISCCWIPHGAAGRDSGLEWAR